MNERLLAFLDDLYSAGREHDAGKPDRLDRLRNVEPDTARLLGLLIRAVGARSVLELGTSNGYSTIWLADAVRTVQGRVVSVDLDEDRSAAAGRNLARAGLSDFAELRVADAGEVLRGCEDSSWDFIFLDAERPLYVDYWADLVRVLRPGAVLAVDNVLSHADQVADFRALVSAAPGVYEALAPTGAGALLVCRERT